MGDAGPAAINRPLTDDERTLMMQLAVWTVAEQTGASDKAAADWLDGLIERIGLYLEGDARDVYIKTSRGKVIVHATREWLAFFAVHAEGPIDVSKYTSWFKDGTRGHRVTLKPCRACGVRSPSPCCLQHGPDQSTVARGYDRRWRVLSERARRLQPFCTDCGSTEDLQADHSPQAWARKAEGKVLRLEDVEVVCGRCNRDRGAAR